MAEAYLSELGKKAFYAESAGLEPGELNPSAVAVMAEAGIDISTKSTHSVFDYFKEGRKYDLVVKVCDQANSDRCPIFPSAKFSVAWDIPDPAAISGSPDKILRETRLIRDQIKAKVECLISVFGDSQG